MYIKSNLEEECERCQCPDREVFDIKLGMSLENKFTVWTLSWMNTFHHRVSSSLAHGSSEKCKSCSKISPPSRRYSPIFFGFMKFYCCRSSAVHVVSRGSLTCEVSWCLLCEWKDLAAEGLHFKNIIKTKLASTICNLYLTLKQKLSWILFLTHSPPNTSIDVSVFHGPPTPNTTLDVLGHCFI